MKEKSYLDEFVFNPTFLTRSILNNTLLPQLIKYKQKYTIKNFSKKLILVIQLTKLYYSDYRCLYDFIIENNKKIDLVCDIRSVLEKIRELFDKILLINILIQYGFQKEKIINAVISSTAERMRSDFYKLSEKKITPKTFKKRFGHYSTNEYELAAPRYAEYEDKELLEFANQIFKKQKFKELQTMTYNDYTRGTIKYLLPVYIFLREEFKSLNLRYLFKLKIMLSNKYGKIKYNKDIMKTIESDIKNV